MNEKIYIAFSNEDREKVSNIKRQIESILHISCKLDSNNSDDGNNSISAINAAEIFIFMYSKYSAVSEWNKKELEFAKQKGKKLVFIKIDDSQLEDWFMFMYSSHDIIDFSIENQRKKLIRNLAIWCNATLPEEYSVKENITETDFNSRIDAFKKRTHSSVIFLTLCFVVLNAILLIYALFSGAVMQEQYGVAGFVLMLIAYVLAIKYLLTFRRKILMAILIFFSQLTFLTCFIFPIIFLLCLVFAKKDGKSYWDLAY